MEAEARFQDLVELTVDAEIPPENRGEILLIQVLISDKRGFTGR
jgi:hypothetical protein